MQHEIGDNWHVERQMFGQDGIFGAIKLSRYLQIGSEFNWSWNSWPYRPVEFYVTTWDTVENDSVIFSEDPVWCYSNTLEYGFGIKADLNNHIFIAQSLKFSHKMDRYSTIFFPAFWEHEWNTSSNDFRSITNFGVKTSIFQIVTYYSIDKNRIHYRDYYPPYDSSTIEYPLYCPKIAVLLTPRENILIAGGFVYEYQKHEIHYIRNLIFPAAFEEKINSHFTIRFGTTFQYSYKDTYGWIAVWPRITEALFFSETNFGLDYYPYEKLVLSFATQDILKIDRRKWFFGLGFAL